MSNDSLPPWDEVLSAAARLQQLVPEAVLVGGTAAAIHAAHRFSRDADHVLTDLRPRFDDLLAELESVAGWRTARVNRPVLILGSLDGIETGIRQLVRVTPLETQEVMVDGQPLRLPTPAEMLRIKRQLRTQEEFRTFDSSAERATGRPPCPCRFPRTQGIRSASPLAAHWDRW